MSIKTFAVFLGLMLLLSTGAQARQAYGLCDTSSYQTDEELLCVRDEIVFMLTESLFDFQLKYKQESKSLESTRFLAAGASSPEVKEKFEALEAQQLEFLEYVQTEQDSYSAQYVQAKMERIRSFRDAASAEIFLSATRITALPTGMPSPISFESVDAWKHAFAAAFNGAIERHQNHVYFGQLSDRHQRALTQYMTTMRDNFLADYETATVIYIRLDEILGIEQAS